MNQQIKTADSTNIQGLYVVFVEQILNLLQEIRKIDPEILKNLDLLQAVECSNNSVTLAFGGCFSSGKSTLINALLRRPLLPTAKIPETGTLCFIQSGAEDKAEIISQKGISLIPFTTESITTHVSLIDRITGESKQRVLETEEVRLQVTHSHIPRGQVILDSPGINDSEHMNARGALAASRADVLVWILRSSHILSESEQAFLSTYISRRGFNQLIFVLNAYLDEDTLEAWNQFYHSELNYYLNKIRDFCLKNQLPEKEVVVVSARAFAKYDTSDFGGIHLIDTLLSYSHSTKTAVLLARISRIQHGLILLQQSLEQHLEQQTAVYEFAKVSAERDAKARLDKVHRSLNSVMRTAKSHTDSWLDNHTLEKVAENLAQAITSATLNRNGKHSEEVNQAFSNFVEKGVAEIVAAISSTAQFEQVYCNVKLLHQSFLQQVKPPTVTIDVPDTPISGSTIASGAAAGAAAGAWIFGIGAVAGAAVGAILSCGASSSEAIEKDIQITKSTIREAGRAAQSHLEIKSRDIDKVAITYCKTTIPEVLMPDNTQLSLLSGLLKKTCRLKDEIDFFLKGISV